MVGPAVRPSHSPSDGYVPDVTVPCDDIVYEVPVVGAWVHPSGHVNVWLLEEAFF